MMVLSLMMLRALTETSTLKRLTIKYFEGIKLLFTLECVHKESNVKVWLHFNTPSARLGVKIVAWIPRAEDHPRRFRSYFIGWALC